MTNYEKYFKDKMRDSEFKEEFIKSQREVELEWKIEELKEYIINLKDTISLNKPKSEVFKIINLMEKELTI